MWNEQPIWNETTNTKISATSHDVIVDLDQSASVKVYDVLTGSLVDQSADANSGDVAMSDRPMIVEIAPASQITSAVCSAAGTHIRTARGDVTVEQLVVGDDAITSSGGPRRILWLDHRKIDCRRHPRPAEVMPIRIAAAAVAENVPARDLWVSRAMPFAST